MPDPLRDRVARVLYDMDPFMVMYSFGQQAIMWGDLNESERAVFYAQADALIAAGLVTECGELPGTAFEVMATRHGLPIMLYHGAHDNPLRVRSWTHDGDRILVEYVEVTS